jgi:hypothetical protein
MALQTVTNNIDPLTKQAETLVQAANTKAITAFVALLDKFPLLKSVDTKQWDFVLTIAGVFIDTFVRPRERKSSKSRPSLVPQLSGSCQFDSECM